MSSSPISPPHAALVNCTAWPYLEPDADVTGIGVVLGFLFSSYLTLLFTVFRLLLPDQGSIVPLDQALREIVVPRYLTVNRPELCRKLTMAVESTILTISDLQLITSVAILVSGYVQLSKGISLYHWTNIVDLAWFSALTHLATLTSLRHFFRSRPIVASARVILMGLVLVLLSVAFFPTGFHNQRFHSAQDSADFENDFEKARRDYDSYFVSAPALCFYSTSSAKTALAGLGAATLSPGIPKSNATNTFANSFNFGLVGISVMFLIISYVTRVVRIYETISRPVEKWLRIVPMDILQRRYRVLVETSPTTKYSRLNKACRLLLLIAMTLAEACYEVGDSMLWEILWLSSAVAWGTLRLIELRIDTALVGKVNWSFGQVLALSLCVHPVWEFSNALLDRSGAVSDPTTEPGSARLQRRLLSTLEDIEDTIWFRNLTVLIIGMATIIAAVTLFHLPAATLSNWSLGLGVFASGKDVALTFLVYVMVLVFCLVILGTLIAVKLGL
ncbi:MAG: hypothetical protein Q9207_006611 [Kuettlingeria erythrocarpa]